MLTTQAAPPAAPAADGDELNIREIWNGVLRNRWLVLGTTLAVVLLGLAYIVRSRPVYGSTATLSLDLSRQQRDILSELSPLAGVGGAGRIETEMAILRSRQIAEAVVDSLGLAVQVDEPKRPRAEVVRPLAVPRNAPAGTWVLERRDDGSYSVEAKKPVRGVRVPPRVRIGVPFQLGGATLALAPSLADDPPGRITLTVSRFEDAVAALQSGLGVSRPDPKADVLAVSYQSTDPALAAAVPNAATATFIGLKASWNRAEVQGTVRFLREQVSQYAGELQRAEEGLRSFREAQRVVNPQEEATQQVQRLAQLQAERDRLRSERDALARLLNQVGSAQRAADAPSPFRQLASFPVFLSNRAIQDMLQSLTDLENQRALLLVRRTERNEDVRGFDKRIQDIELQLYQMSRNYLEGLDSQIGSAEQTLSRFNSALGAIPSREVEFARLSRNQELVGELYKLLQTRLKEAEIRQAGQASDIRVIDAALVPTRPMAPRPLRTGVLSLMLGLLAGLAAALAREVLDTKVRTKEDVQAATSGMPVLALIPRFRLQTEGQNGSRARRVSGDRIAGLLPVVQANPQSPAAEAFRALRTTLAFSTLDRPPQALVITSAVPGEGKSTSSVNLALTQAQQGARTLLVDADLRRGTLHNLLQTPSEPGLTHVLLGRASLDEALVEVPGEHGGVLHFLPTGVFPPNPAELLGSDAMARLMKELRSRFDAIVLDAPPLNLVTDASIMARLVDGAVLVTRTGFTDKRALQHAAMQLQQVHARICGVVLNDVDVEGSGRYYGYGYGYSYGSYGVYANQGNGSNGKH
ncbi:MAG TPA: polysaccharide biosynthesis tyrosine autokinase [Longimicrobium sp.]